MVKFDKSKLKCYGFSIAGIIALGISVSTLSMAQEKKNVNVNSSSLSTTTCPPDDIIYKDLNSLGAPMKLKIKNKTLITNNICQVVVESNGMMNTIYVTSNNKYMLLGSMLDLKKKINISQEAIQRAMDITQQQASNLDKYVVFTYYQGKSYYTNPPAYKQYVYFITDPKCPFCHEAEPMIEKWANKHNIALRVVFNPLPIHPESHRTAIGLYCNKKGMNSLYNAYNSKNFLSQCSQGQKLIKDSNNYLFKELKLYATPTFVKPNGSVFLGVPASSKVFNQWFFSNTK